MEMNGWIMIILILLLLVAALYFSGYLLPKAYTNEATLLLRSSPERVWEAISDMEALPVSGSAHAVQPLEGDPERPAWLIDIGSTQITVQTVEANPPRALVRVLADAVVPMTARYEYHLSPMGSGTDLTIREEGYIDSGTWHVPIFRFMVRLMRGAGVRLYGQQLAAHLGESAVPVVNGKPASPR